MSVVLYILLLYITIRFIVITDRNIILSLIDLYVRHEDFYAFIHHYIVTSRQLLAAPQPAKPLMQRLWLYSWFRETRTV
jgi:hypothetical protein